MKPETAARILATAKNPTAALKTIRRARKRELRTAIAKEARDDQAKRLAPVKAAMQNARRAIIKRGGL